ncbi:MAG: hypothetical protein PHG27_00530 [Massilibacteroides sp.]|nr:hypothetical protein [Massilibacteroides sp.]MDD3062104.1 hypothetical protein [Massilibacteroides sp.]MDD4114072.1 hypothetical protein [Massilibacteroides sp.]MDD4659648.1 hypothetical protein [Massilibacteroides sp.]
MTRLLILTLLFLSFTNIRAQRQNFSYKFYGQVRGDLFYNSRANEETVDGLFFLFPKDKSLDPNGNDLNATSNGNLYMLYSRLGVDIKGPDIGRAKSTVKVESDFRGSGSTFALLRIRHAYANLDWGKSDVTIGQTWHPLFGDVSPQVLNLSTGAPFQPFNRSPLVMYKYIHKEWQLKAAAVWQLQYLSTGPKGKAEDYLKNGCIPELYGSIDYKTQSWQSGIGIDFLSLKPRTQSTVEKQNGNKQTYKVDERINSFTLEAHAKYISADWFIAGKTLLASNQVHNSMIGGYAVTKIDPQTGEQQYTPYRHSLTWLNLVYGKKWKPGFFIGYMKNLGTSNPIVGEKYGTGLNLDQLLATQFQLTYNLPHWKFGFEYMPSIAWYGTMDPGNGKIKDTYTLTNHRILGVMLYLF